MAKKEKPQPEMRYRDRMLRLAKAATDAVREVVTQDRLPKKHAAPEQFQSFVIAAYAPDMSGDGINFHAASESACLPQFPPFVLAAGVDRLLKHQAATMVHGDLPGYMQMLQSLQDQFMQHLVGMWTPPEAGKLADKVAANDVGQPVGEA